MRNREIVEYLIKIKSSFIIEASNVNASMIIVENHRFLMEELQKLEKMKLFLAEIDELKKMELYNNILPEIRIHESIYNKYALVLNTVITKINGIIESSKLFQNKVNDYSIAIKIPPVNRLKELAEFTEKLDKCISLAISDKNLRTDYTISSFDKGSMWYEICLNIKDTFLVFGSVVFAGLCIQKKKLENEEIKIRLAALNANAKSINDVEVALDSEIKTLIELNAQQIINKHNISENDIEYKSRLILSIKEMMTLIQNGCEVHKLSENNKDDDFPDFSKPELLESKIKQCLLKDNEDVE